MARWRPAGPTPATATPAAPPAAATAPTPASPTASPNATTAGLGVSLAGTSNSPALGRQFRVVNNDSTDNVSGTFAGAPEGSIITVGGVSYGITYRGGTGNDVVLARLGRFDFNAVNNPGPPI